MILRMSKGRGVKVHERSWKKEKGGTMSLLFILLLI